MYRQYENPYKLNKYLCVRRAENGEKIITLDEVERELTTDSVLIATKEAPVCLGGVFGGNNSEIDDNTKNIALVQMRSAILGGYML